MTTRNKLKFLLPVILHNVYGGDPMVIKGKDVHIWWGKQEGEPSEIHSIEHMEKFMLKACIRLSQNCKIQGLDKRLNITNFIYKRPEMWPRRIKLTEEIFDRMDISAYLMGGLIVKRGEGFEVRYNDKLAMKLETLRQLLDWYKGETGVELTTK